jgi:hypothetical protein
MIGILGDIGIVSPTVFREKGHRFFFFSADTYPPNNRAGYLGQSQTADIAHFGA